MTDVYDWDQPEAKFIPQLANAVEIDKVNTRCAGYSMEMKLDGIRGTVYKRGDDVRIYSRTLHSLHEKLPHLVEEFRSYTEDFILDGEIGYDMNRDYPVIDFNRTVRVTGSGIDEALAKQEANRELDGAMIRFYAFDLLASGPVGRGLKWAGDLPQYERRIQLDQFALGHFTPQPLNVTTEPGYVERVPRSPLWSEREYIDYVDEYGGEGVILKNPDARYVPGKRPANNWYKVKKFQTEDVIITGYTMGEGKYTNQIGAVTFKMQGGTEGKCSGMTDAQRSLFTEYGPHYMGKCMEIRYWGKVASGPRFPQFVRLRPDKDV